MNNVVRYTDDIDDDFRDYILANKYIEVIKLEELDGFETDFLIKTADFFIATVLSGLLYDFLKSVFKKIWGNLKLKGHSVILRFTKHKTKIIITNNQISLISDGKIRLVSEEEFYKVIDRMKDEKYNIK